MQIQMSLLAILMFIVQAVNASDSHSAHTPTADIQADIPAANVAKSAPSMPTPHAPTHAGVSSEQALKYLRNGNTRFVRHHLRKDGQSMNDVKRLSTGQQPHSIVLSCSDSRVPPEVVFDQKLGEIFTVRTAGQALESNAIGSIEYAVEHLGSKLVLVMGHTNCGAVKAALDTIKGKDAGTPALNALVKGLHPHLLKFKESPRSKDVADESWANTEGVARDLIAQSDLLKEKWEKGEIKVQTALYNLSSGEVEFAPNPLTPVLRNKASATVH